MAGAPDTRDLGTNISDIYRAILGLSGQNNATAGGITQAQIGANAQTNSARIAAGASTSNAATDAQSRLQAAQISADATMKAAALDAQSRANEIQKRTEADTKIAQMQAATTDRATQAQLQSAREKIAADKENLTRQLAQEEAEFQRTYGLSVADYQHKVQMDEASLAANPSDWVAHASYLHNQTPPTPLPGTGGQVPFQPPAAGAPANPAPVNNAVAPPSQTPQNTQVVAGPGTTISSGTPSNTVPGRTSPSNTFAPQAQAPMMAPQQGGVSIPGMIGGGQTVYGLPSQPAYGFGSLQPGMMNIPGAAVGGQVSQINASNGVQTNPLAMASTLFNKQFPQVGGQKLPPSARPTGPSRFAASGAKPEYVPGAGATQPVEPPNAQARLSAPLRVSPPPNSIPTSDPDVVWMPDGAGNFTPYIHDPNMGGWHEDDSNPSGMATNDARLNPMQPNQADAQWMAGNPQYPMGDARNSPMQPNAADAAWMAGNPQYPMGDARNSPMQSTPADAEALRQKQLQEANPGYNQDFWNWMQTQQGFGQLRTPQNVSDPNFTQNSINSMGQQGQVTAPGQMPGLAPNQPLVVGDNGRERIDMPGTRNDFTVNSPQVIPGLPPGAQVRPLEHQAGGTQPMYNIMPANQEAQRLLGNGMQAPMRMPGAATGGEVTTQPNPYSQISDPYAAPMTTGQNTALPDAYSSQDYANMPWVKNLANGVRAPAFGAYSGPLSLGGMPALRNTFGSDFPSVPAPHQIAPQSFLAMDPTEQAMALGLYRALGFQPEEVTAAMARTLPGQTQSNSTAWRI